MARRNHPGLRGQRGVLSDDRLISNIDHLGEPWALRLPPLPLEIGKLAGHIKDQHSRYNLSNLVRTGQVNPIQLAHFRRLLEVLDLPAALADTLVDWLDADNERNTRDGAEDADYLAAMPSYLAANQPLTDLTEIALVRGHDEDVRAPLAPYVTAMPRDVQVADDDITVSSDYFMARVHVTIGGAEATGTALLARQGADWPMVVWRKSL